MFYGARMYDPAIARFTGIDPISDQFAWVSTYNYAENDPVGAIDLHGLQKMSHPFEIQMMAQSLSNQNGTDLVSNVNAIQSASRPFNDAPDVIGLAPVVGLGGFVVASSAAAGYTFAALNPEATAAIGSFIFGAVTEQDLPGGFDDAGRIGKRALGETINSLREILGAGRGRNIAFLDGSIEGIGDIGLAAVSGLSLIHI